MALQERLWPPAPGAAQHSPFIQEENECSAHPGFADGDACNLKARVSSLNRF